MAGGFKQFGPTYNTTLYVRLGYEGILNGTHEINVTDAQLVNGELAGKFASIKANGTIGVASEGGADAIGLYREDLADMKDISGKATFYFRGGEYYVAEGRLGAAPADFTIGDKITTNGDGQIVPADSILGSTALGIVTHIGPWVAGNMYQNATANQAPNGTNGDFVGFIMYI